MNIRLTRDLSALKDTYHAQIIKRYLICPTSAKLL